MRTSSPRWWGIPWRGSIFFASVFIEDRVASGRLDLLDAPRASRWSWHANRFSYSVTFVVLAAAALVSALSAQR